MIIRDLKKAVASDRKVDTDGWNSVRMLLKDDGMGFSFHITTMYAGKELAMHYKNHLESVFVLSGEGTIEDLDAGVTHELRPGVLYVLNRHDRHVVRPRTDIVTACVFNPPVTGREVHDASGAYPSESEMAGTAAA